MTLDELLSSFASLTPTPVSIGYRAPDEDFARFVWTNQSFLDAFGFALEDISRVSVHDLICPDHIDALLVSIEPRAAGDMDRFTRETMFVRRDGTRFWGQLSVLFMPWDRSGGRYSAAVYHDLDALKERERLAENALRENQGLLEDATAVRERLLLAIDCIPTPLAIWDRNWKLVVCNEVFAPRLLAREGRLDPGTPVEAFLREAAGAGQLQDAEGREDRWYEQALASLKGGPIDEVTRYTDGAIYRAFSSRAPNGDTIVYNADITEFTHHRRQLEAKNLQLELARAEADIRALHDDLTSLGNRRFIGEGLAELLEERETRGGEVATLAIDLDRFKQINDTLGHTAGDFVLAAVAARLKEALAPGDLVGRVGGDEFVVLRRVESDGEPAEVLGRRIVEAMSRPFHFEDAELRLGASIGVASTPLSSEGELLPNADIALYKAKSAGRGAVVSFDEKDLAEMIDAKRRSDAILDAVERRAFVPHYQPQIEAGTGRIVALEALARWVHPTRGLLLPGEFLQTAADLGVIDDIDDIIFEKALADCGEAFGSAAAPTLSFNISQDTFLCPSLASRTRLARDYPGGIAFELLETILFEDLGDHFALQLDGLREAGASIEIDDFGSGRASIVALQQIEPDRLKIDRRLVSGVAEVEQSAKLVKAIVDIGRAFGIGITAEGVETDQQAERLASLGCDRLQGYLTGRPMPFDDLVALHRCSLKRRRAG